MMTGCRAIYTALNPICGDGVLAYPEQCDSPGSSTCNAACQTVACGDGRVDSPEQCDDENTTDGDGCAADCVERCGNAILQAGEECDGDRVDSTPACPIAPRRAAATDRRAGTGCPARTAAARATHCLSGSFTVGTVETSAATSQASRSTTGSAST
jgi:cysteine-rich repeat protein